VGGKLLFKSHYSEKSPDCSLADSIDDCPSNCFGNGDCVDGTCLCFLGFKGPDCGRGGSIPSHNAINIRHHSDILYSAVRIIVTA